MINLIKNILDHFKEVDTSNKPTPCISCGACCNYFAVKFDRSKNPQVPWQKITIFSSNEAAMIGAEKFKGRCISLVGKVGEKTMCSIYENRSDTCVSFSVWNKNGKQNPKCIKAREHHGLVGRIEE